MFAVVLLAAVLLGFSATLIYEYFSLDGEGVCGAVSGCPHGAWIRWIAYPLLFLSFIVVSGALRGTQSARGALAGILAVCAAIGIVPGIFTFRAAHGPTFDALWAGSPERPETKSVGTWLYGGAIVRAWADGLTAFDVRTGRQRWTIDLTGANALCSMSREHTGGVALIAQGGARGACTNVSAIDLGSGRTLWERPYSSLQSVRRVRGAAPEPAPELDLELAPAPSEGVSYDVLAVAGNTAILRKPRWLGGLDLRSGRVLWKAQSVSADCDFGDVAATGDQAIAHVACTGGPKPANKIRGFDPATGAVRWEVALPGAGVDTKVGLVSAAPSVVHVSEEGRTGSNSLVALNGEGRITATIPVEMPNGTKLDVDPYAFDAAPLRRVVVHKDMLIAMTEGAERATRNVTAYGLSDGRPRWTTETAEIKAMAVRGDRLLLLTFNSMHFTSRFTTVALADGAKEYVGVMRFELRFAEAGLFLDGRHAAIVREEATEQNEHPITVVRLPS